MDTGMGTRAYSFIQQGQIDLILSSKPKDRRLLLEEAAGITRYKLRRADAEKRLDETKLNLQRLDDILFELNKQMDSLRRQASRARKAKELDTDIKVTQRILLAGKAVELEAAKQRILDQLDQTERRVAELTAQVSEKASEVETLRLSVDEQQQAQAKRASAMLGLDQRLQLAEQERSFQEERRTEGLEPWPNGCRKQAPPFRPWSPCCWKRRGSWGRRKRTWPRSRRSWPWPRVPCSTMRPSCRTCGSARPRARKRP